MKSNDLSVLRSRHNPQNQQNSTSTTLEIFMSNNNQSQFEYGSCCAENEDEEIDDINALNTNSNIVTTSQDQQRRKKLKYIKYFLLLLITITLILVISSGDIQIINKTKEFLNWVEENKEIGIVAFILVYAITVSCILPGTPLIFGSGFIFTECYDDKIIGMTVALLCVLSGATLGAITSFSLGRFILRDFVQSTFSKYNIIEAIDGALSKSSGFKIMCLLHLCPVIPFGPISYLCGTTTMSIFIFASSNVAIVPLALFYIYVGASMPTLITSLNDIKNKKGADVQLYHSLFIVGGIILSGASLALISYFVKKELDKIIKRNKALKQDELEIDSPFVDEEAIIGETKN